MNFHWNNDNQAYSRPNDTAWHAEPYSMAPTYLTSEAYHYPDRQQYRYSTHCSPSPSPSHRHKRRHHQHHHHHHQRRRRPSRSEPESSPPPATPTSEAQLAAFTARHLVLALERSRHPVSVLINYGHAVILEPNQAEDRSSSKSKSSSSSIVYNAPGCTLTVVPAAAARSETYKAGPTIVDEGSGGGSNSNDDWLRTCRDCGSGQSWSDSAGAGWEGRARGRRREVGLFGGGSGSGVGPRRLLGH